LIVRGGGAVEEIPSKAVVTLQAGDRLPIETAGGGGYGPSEQKEPTSRARDGRDGKVVTA
jgi:N-methylhydantoinase B